MSMQECINKLQQIYQLYDMVCAGANMFCAKGCSLCCTANVTMTTLEAGSMPPFGNPASGRQ
jgi:hypothetical protein